MIGLIKNEFIKTFLKLKTWIAIFLYIAFLLLMFLSCYYANNNSSLPSMSARIFPSTK